MFLPEAAHYPHVLEIELRLYRLTGGKVVTRGKDLPKGAVDLIVTAMEDQEMWSQERCQPWHRSATAWAEACKAPVLAIDPPPHPPAVEVKMTLVGGLPLNHPPEAGKLYLANLGIPKNIYKEVGIKFSSPFGAKFVIPLHICKCQHLRLSVLVVPSILNWPGVGMEAGLAFYRRIFIYKLWGIGNFCWNKKHFSVRKYTLLTINSSLMFLISLFDFNLSKQMIQRISTITL